MQYQCKQYINTANKSKCLIYKNGNKIIIGNSDTQLTFPRKYCVLKDHPVLLTISLFNSFFKMMNVARSYSRNRLQTRQ